MGKSFLIRKFNNSQNFAKVCLLAIAMLNMQPKIDKFLTTKARNYVFGKNFSQNAEARLFYKVAYLKATLRDTREEFISTLK